MKLRLLIILSIFLYGCKEKFNEPLVKSDRVPGVVSDIKVTNLPGGAKVSYSLPADNDLLYVQAEFLDQNGKTKVLRSSIYKNFVTLEGFSNTNEYEVKLFAVNRSENRSAPSIAKIKPLLGPMNDVFASLKVFETFGGIAMNFKNETGAELVLHTFYKDSNGNWVDRDRLYSNAKERSYSIRGFEPNPTEFLFYFTDKWKNFSDTLITTVAPLYEEEVDKALWVDANLLGDSNKPRYGPLRELWTPGPTTYFFQIHTDQNLVLPNWFSIDLGKSYKLGRMKVNDVSHSATWIFSSGTPQIFEIWGSNKASGDWNDWTLLNKFESIKPSGLPPGQNTAEDLALNKAGTDYEFPPSSESYRYVRFKTIKTWGNIPNINILELTFWGQAK